LRQLFKSASGSRLPASGDHSRWSVSVVAENHQIGETEPPACHSRPADAPMRCVL